jgi:hypothetical protein
MTGRVETCLVGSQYIDARRRFNYYIIRGVDITNPPPYYTLTNFTAHLTNFTAHLTNFTAQLANFTAHLTNFTAHLTNFTAYLTIVLSIKVIAKSYRIA